LRLDNLSAEAIYIVVQILTTSEGEGHDPHKIPSRCEVTYPVTRYTTSDFAKAQKVAIGIEGTVLLKRDDIILMVFNNGVLNYGIHA
jgi:hypothetical protein